MRTVEEIYSALAADFVAAGGAALTEGGDMALRLRAVAAELLSLEAQADFVTRQCFPQTATGDCLDLHAELRGLERGAALCAGGALHFSLAGAAESDVSVPAGTVCMTAANLCFVTTEEGCIAAGTLSCSVAAEAVDAGSGGNVPAGSISYMKLAPTGVSAVTNDAAFTGGADDEDDDSLRARVIASYRTLPNGANAAYYRNRVLNEDNVAAVTVLPRNRGIGTVDVYFATESGMPTDAETAAIQTLLDAEREICVDVLVPAPEAATMNVRAALTVEEGCAFDSVAEDAARAVTEFFNGSLLGQPVYRARLMALLMAVDGVANCTLTAPQADLTPADGVLPVLGTLDISEAV